MTNNVINKDASAFQGDMLQEQKPVTLTASNIHSSSEAFTLAQREAKMLSSSNLIPKEFRGNIADCVIALEMALRAGASPFMVLQNLHVINGRPSWSSQYIIALINTSGRYKTELQFELTGTGDAMRCYAFAEDMNGHIVKGPEITMEMAKAEGWVGKNMSKWKTMPEIMIRYRAASFFGRFNCPDLLLGISHSTDELVEGMTDSDYVVVEDPQSIDKNSLVTTEEMEEMPETDSNESFEKDVEEDNEVENQIGVEAFFEGVEDE